MIIGKGGEIIWEMQNIMGCKINVFQFFGSGEMECEIGLVGSCDSIECVKVVICEKVEVVVSNRIFFVVFGFVLLIQIIVE